MVQINIVQTLRIDNYYKIGHTKIDKSQQSTPISLSTFTKYSLKK